MRRLAWCAAALVMVGCGGEGEDPDSGLDASTTVCAAASDCDDGLYCTGAERCDPSDAEADARGCLPGDDPCMSGELCDEDNARCAAEGCENPDADGDGQNSIACGGGDCDDADPGRYPGNTEVCDVMDVDEDCDPRTFGYRDQDMDGNPDASCCNGDTCGRDCDDLDPTIGMDGEICDGRDNDCNGEIDDLAGGGSCSCTVIGETRDCGPDRALDGIGVCRTGTETCAAGVWVCDGAVSEGTETCNGQDDDCDGSIDEGFGCAQGAATDCGPVEDEASWPGDARTCAATGSTVCSALCEASTCTLDTEDCDYCDDDGDGVEDEIPMATGDTASAPWNATTCEQLGRSNCASETLIGSTGRTPYGGLFRSESFTVGYGTVEINGRISLSSPSLCEGTFAVVVYVEPGSVSLGSDPGGVDRSQRGVAIEYSLNSISAVPLAGVTMRELPVAAGSEVASTVPNDGVPCWGSVPDRIRFQIEIEPHSPSGPSGVTRYTLTDYVADNITIEGAPIYPGDQIRIGVVAQEATISDTLAEVTSFFMSFDEVCPGS